MGQSRMRQRSGIDRNLRQKCTLTPVLPTNNKTRACGPCAEGGPIQTLITLAPFSGPFPGKNKSGNLRLFLGEAA